MRSLPVPLQKLRGMVGSPHHAIQRDGLCCWQLSGAAASKSKPSIANLCAGSVSQQQLMQADQCILVDDQDRITGHASKHDSHRCSAFCLAPKLLWLELDAASSLTQWRVH